METQDGELKLASFYILWQSGRFDSRCVLDDCLINDVYSYECLMNGVYTMLYVL